jgi:hypothetical protein
VKSRNPIPGWPRGRSTSRPCADGTVWPWQYVCDVISGKLIGVFDRADYIGLERSRPLRHILDGIPTGATERARDLAADQAEEERKTDMMEDWYAVERVRLYFSFEPDNFLQRHLRKQLRRMWNRPVTNV